MNVDRLMNLAVEELADVLAERVMEKLKEHVDVQSAITNSLVHADYGCRTVKEEKEPDSDGERLLSAAEVLRKIGASRTSLWRWEREGKFPKHRALGDHKVGWLRSEVEKWIQDLETAA